MIEELIKNRRSIRTYQKKDIPKEIVEELVYLANLSPSPMNVQDRHFVVIDKNSALREKLYTAACCQEHILTAPVLIVVVSKMDFPDEKKYFEECIGWGMDFWGAAPDNYIQNSKYLDHYNNLRKVSEIQDSTIALQTLTLAAEDKGLGSCWIGSFDEKDVKTILGLPEKYRVFSMLTLGYPKERPSYPKDVKSISEILHWGKW